MYNTSEIGSYQKECPLPDSVVWNLELRCTAALIDTVNGDSILSHHYGFASSNFISTRFVAIMTSFTKFLEGITHSQHVQGGTKERRYYIKESSLMPPYHTDNYFNTTS